MRREQRNGRRRLGGTAGDPLDGLVNLFDLGIVLAVAFLIAGLASTVNRQTGRIEPRSTSQHAQRQIPSQAKSTPARGKGKAIGTVYRLADGRLIYTEHGAP